MFTKKLEPDDGITKLGEKSDTESPFTERPATYAKSSSSTKMVPSIIGEDLSITGNVTSKGELQIDGEILGRYSLRLAPARRQVAGHWRADGRGHRGARPRGRLD